MLFSKVLVPYVSSLTVFVVVAFGVCIMAMLSCDAGTQCDTLQQILAHRELYRSYNSIPPKGGWWIFIRGVLGGHALFTNMKAQHENDEFSNHHCR